MPQFCVGKFGRIGRVALCVQKRGYSFVPSTLRVGNRLVPEST
jgi:hypothetical protein